MTMRIVLLALASVSLGSCGEQAPPAERPPAGPAARVVGEATNCLTRSQYRETRIRDDSTIDFMRNSTSGWRNTLPNRCPGLRSANAFTFRSTGSQICSLDIIHVLETTGGTPRRGTACGLGRFVPIEIDRP
jgi:hypothetical protein